MEHVNKSLTVEDFDVVIGDEFALACVLCTRSQWKISAIVMGCTMPISISIQPHGSGQAFSKANIQTICFIFSA